MESELNRTPNLNLDALTAFHSVVARLACVAKAISCSIGQGDRAEARLMGTIWKTSWEDCVVLGFSWHIDAASQLLLAKEERPDGLLAKHAYSVLQAWLHTLRARSEDFS